MNCIKNNREIEDCEICDPQIQHLHKQQFISHLLGKKHNKNDKLSRFEEMPNKEKTLLIKDFSKSHFHRAIEYFWDYNIMDIDVYGRDCNIRFKTKVDAENVLKQDHHINKRLLNITHKSETISKKASSSSSADGWKKVEHQKHPLIISQELSHQMNITYDENGIDNVILQLIKELELKRNDYEQREKARFFMEQFLTTLFPGAKVYNFGSSVNSLGFRRCDVDMYADLQYNPWRCRDIMEGNKKAAMLTRHLGKEIRNRKRGYHVVSIPGARVPIVKFHEWETGLSVDLSFRNPMPLCNTSLIRLYAHCHPIVRPYLMFLRYWANVQNVAGGAQPKNLITNYCFTMIMLFVLMVRKDPIVPTVCELQQKLYRSRDPSMRTTVVDGWNCSFSTDVAEWQEKFHETSIIRLAIEFFEYFATVHLSETVISPLCGYLLSRKDLSSKDETKLPNALYPFCRSNEPRFSFTNCFCVQDPFEQNRNLSKGLSEKSLKMFRIKCRRSARICWQILHQKSTIAQLFEPIVIDPQTIDDDLIENVASIRTLFTDEKGSTDHQSEGDDDDTLDTETSTKESVMNDKNGLFIPLEVGIQIDLPKQYKIDENGSITLQEIPNNDSCQDELLHALLMYVLEKCLIVEVSKDKELLDNFEPPLKRQKTDSSVPDDRISISLMSCVMKLDVCSKRKTLSKQLCLSKHLDSPLHYQTLVSELVSSQIKNNNLNIVFKTHLTRNKLVPSQYYINFYLDLPVTLKEEQHIKDSFLLLSSILFETKEYITSLATAS